MQADFWLQRWQNNNIGFHLTQPNPLLCEHLPQLKLSRNARIVMPLCGKSVDIDYLLQQGYRVAAIELCEIAIAALQQRLGLNFTYREQNGIGHYHHPQIDLYVGDIFQLTAAQLGAVDAVYDRAAIIALPFEMRQNYSQHLLQLSQVAPQLLISLEYPQQDFAGPPFSVTASELAQHYAQHYTLNVIKDQSTERLFGSHPGREKAWLLQPLAQPKKL
ncbi:thiopurine S-methyltransferase [Acinetobacter larvae]|uniref:Thiopurine S-methyltransferase n=1 Tax=Acinetobacter larvae TaxID=1789224 RepID=A0A1B2LXI3_9GAMM|nr:thiopurine S-methyltransferase [Acinetobacter larvae]AOA57640.1 thiopurine S-methyltransferase [Acinetobacter larvae]